MQKCVNTRMGFGWILISAFFLFNPVIACVDILPDIVGYLCLWIGLSRLADINDDIDEALKRVRYLFWLTVAYLVLFEILQDSIQTANPSLMNPYEGRSTTFLFAVVRMLLQCFLLIPTYRLMFRGIDRLSDRFGDEVLSRERHFRTKGDRMARRSTVFVIANSLLSALPEATTLTSGNENTFSTFDWYDFIFMFRTLGVFLSLIFSGIWLIFFIAYFGRVLRRRVWLAQLRTAYNAEVRMNPGMFRMRRFARSFLLLAIAVAFSLNLRVDQKALLPGFLLAILATLALLLLGKLLPQRKQCLIPCVFLCAVSIARWVMDYIYFSVNLYDPTHSLYYPAAFEQFFLLRILSAAESVAVVLVLLYVLQLLVCLARTHVVVDYGTPGSEALSARATKKLHRSFEIRAKMIAPIFAVAGLVNMLDAALRIDYPWLWTISFVITLVGMLLLYRLLADLFTEIKNRYLSEDMHKNA